jgi:Fur family transcriptional regulator, ferric uptake regulator
MAPRATEVGMPKMDNRARAEAAGQRVEAAGQRVEAIRQRLRSRGMRWTVAKGAVIEALIDQHDHLSAVQIHAAVAERFPQVDRSTVHRVLIALADEGVVHVLGQSGDARYGLADRAHHHAVCVGCGAVAEIPSDAVGQLLDKATGATGYRFDEESLTLNGRCPRCR